MSEPCMFPAGGSWFYCHTHDEIRLRLSDSTCRAAASQADSLRQAAERVASIHPDNYGFIEAWEALRAVLRDDPA